MMMREDITVESMRIIHWGDREKQPKMMSREKARVFSNYKIFMTGSCFPARIAMQDSIK